MHICFPVFEPNGVVRWCSESDYLRGSSNDSWNDGISFESTGNRRTPPIEAVRTWLLGLSEPGNAQRAGGSMNQADIPVAKAQAAVSRVTWLSGWFQIWKRKQKQWTNIWNNSDFRHTSFPIAFKYFKRFMLLNPASFWSSAHDNS